VGAVVLAIEADEDALPDGHATTVAFVLSATEPDETTGSEYGRGY
jgi:hypothetical protein